MSFRSRRPPGEDPEWTHPENSQRQLLRLNLLRRPPPRALSNRSFLDTRRALPLFLFGRHRRLPARDPFGGGVVRGKRPMRSQFFRIPRQLVDLIKFLVPAHEVQTNFDGFPLRTCVEINQCDGCTRQFFSKSFLGDGAAVLARSSGEERAPPRYRAGVACVDGVEDDATIQLERAVKFDFHTAPNAPH